MSMTKGLTKRASHWVFTHHPSMVGTVESSVPSFYPDSNLGQQGWFMERSRDVESASDPKGYTKPRVCKCVKRVM